MLSFPPDDSFLCLLVCVFEERHPRSYYKSMIRHIPENNFVLHAWRVLMGCISAFDISVHTWPLDVFFQFCNAPMSLPFFFMNFVIIFWITTKNIYLGVSSYNINVSLNNYMSLLSFLHLNKIDFKKTLLLAY